jgi:hypothetical protein
MLCQLFHFGVFGSLVKQWKLKQKAERADWLTAKARQKP